MSSYSTLNCDLIAYVNLSCESVNIKCIAVAVGNGYGHILISAIPSSINAYNSSAYDNVLVIRSRISICNAHFNIVIAGIVTVNSCSCACADLSGSVIGSHITCNGNYVTNFNISLKSVNIKLIAICILNVNGNVSKLLAPNFLDRNNCSCKSNCCSVCCSKSLSDSINYCAGHGSVTFITCTVSISVNVSRNGALKITYITLFVASVFECMSSNVITGRTAEITSCIASTCIAVSTVCCVNHYYKVCYEVSRNLIYCGRAECVECVVRTDEVCAVLGSSTGYFNSECLVFSIPCVNS